MRNEERKINYESFWLDVHEVTSSLELAVLEPTGVVRSKFIQIVTGDGVRNVVAKVVILEVKILEEHTIGSVFLTLIIDLTDVQRLAHELVWSEHHSVLWLAHYFLTDRTVSAESYKVFVIFQLQGEWEILLDISLLETSLISSSVLKSLADNPGNA
jgi:hypothetical protein